MPVTKKTKPIKTSVVESIKGWKTITANSVFLIPFAIEALGYIIGSPDIKAIIPNEYLPAYGIFVGLANIFLRAQTTTPVGKKQ